MPGRQGSGVGSRGRSNLRTHFTEFSILLQLHSAICLAVSFLFSNFRAKEYGEANYGP